MPGNFINGNSISNTLNVLAVIVERHKADIAATLLKNDVLTQLVILAEGTASSSMLEFLGLGSTEKALIACMTPSSKIPDLLKTLNDKLGLEHAGRGIAFSIPLSGAGVPGLKPEYVHMWEKWQNEMEEEVRDMTEHSEYDLIVGVVDDGDSDTLMAAARSAGATGGTLLSALHIGKEETKNFFGVPLKEPRDVVMILAKREDKSQILKTISEKFSKDLQSVFFSLPVDNVSKIDKDS